MDDLETMEALLLSYVGLLAERNAYAPGENFEYALWDDLHRDPATLQLLERPERNELIPLVIHTDKWVAYNMDTGRFQLIDLDAWLELLEKRGH
jgi:hypothetical protein